MMSHNTEADILAATYGDACTVYRPVKRMLPNLETVIRDGLDGEIVMSGIPALCPPRQAASCSTGRQPPTSRRTISSLSARRWISGRAIRYLSPASERLIKPSRVSRSGSRATIISR